MKASHILLPMVFLAAATPFDTTIGQTLTTLYHFGQDADFGVPNGVLVQGSDGNFYGTTKHEPWETNHTGGTIFRLTPTGKLTTLHRFSGGTDPADGLTLADDGNFYGITAAGGTNHFGTIFKISPAGNLTTLHHFCGASDGSEPRAELLQANDGCFYGITPRGGRKDLGTVFKITSTGTLTTLWHFSGFDGTPGTQPDGACPSARLVQGTDGNLYRMTGAGGTNLLGTIFKISPAGTLTTLYQFGLADGYQPRPNAALLQASDGSFYGTTYTGGAKGLGAVFKISSAGTFTTLFQFSGPDGENPNGLVQGSDGTFYGTTYKGGNGQGTVFRITPTGTLTTLWQFDGFKGGGAYPLVGLVQGSDHFFYGTTSIGGNEHGLNAYGSTIFKLPLSLSSPRSEH